MAAPLTTGQVARICSVTPRTVAAWIDAGHLAGHRVAHDDRRVWPDHLASFLAEHDMTPGQRSLDMFLGLMAAMEK